MKIAALALASALAAVVGSAQPSFAQYMGQNDQNESYQNQDNSQGQNDEDRYDQSGMNSQTQNEDTHDESSTTGQNSYGDHQSGQFQGSDDDNTNNRNWRNNRMGSNGLRQNNNSGAWSHHGRMEGRMGEMWRHRMMMGMMRSQAARFSFSNGEARMNVQCPSNDSLQDCVQAAGQLLDKISNLRKSSTSSSTSSGSTRGSIPTIPGAVAVPPVGTSPTGQ